ncbi:MAG: hypothetical protein ACRC6O_03085 [Flavobacterium sp.]
MNEAHVHLVVNHFPIIGTILGFGVLVFGLILKNNSVKNTAFFLFIVAAVFAAVSMNTGEGAEELVEDMPTIGREIIHEHEEMAEKLALALYVLGVTSAVGFYLDYKKAKHSNLVAYFAIVIAIVAVILAQQTGTTGGEIRHTEIRKVTIPNDVRMKDKERH